MRTIIWFIYFWAYLLWANGKLRRGLRDLAAGNDQAVDELTARWVPHWAGSLLRLAGVTVTVTGKENIPAGRPCVFVANHRSYYDIPLMLTQLDGPHGLVSKAEVDRIPLVRGWMRLLRCVFVDRADTHSSLEALRRATETVSRGYSMILFPEGTRNKGPEGSVLEFKGGAFRIATKNGSPVVPVAIQNSRGIMENNGGWMHPAHVTITILPPVETAGMDRQAVRALPEEIRGRIEAALHQKED